MKNKTLILQLIVSVVVLFAVSCSNPSMKTFAPETKLFRVEGIAMWPEDDRVRLIGSASSVSFVVEGQGCTVHLKNESNQQNYVSVEVGGAYYGRFRLEGDSLLDLLIDTGADARQQVVKVFKATEAANGSILFCGVSCTKLAKLPPAPAKAIEFIGNSITCGMGNDYEEIPCNTALWYDQHNAYLAYGAVLSRMLNVRFQLTSVSGIGIYRNWDVDGPTMPRVFENQYLNTNNELKRDFSVFTPDIVSICLGTNDFSDGDGIHERLPFDAERFTESYIRFVGLVLEKYPNSKIVLLNSPMVSGEKDRLFRACLDQVVYYYDTTLSKKIERFNFEAITPHGCDYHPDIADHQLMAEQLYPFLLAMLQD